MWIYIREANGCLTNLHLGKKAAISQTIVSDAFSWMKNLYFDYNFTDVCSEGSNWQWPSIGLDNGLASKRRHAIIWTNITPIHWHIYAAQGGDESEYPNLKW